MKSYQSNKEAMQIWMQHLAKMFKIYSACQNDVLGIWQFFLYDSYICTYGNLYMNVINLCGTYLQQNHAIKS